MTEGRPISLEELCARFEREQAESARLNNLRKMVDAGGAQGKHATKAWWREIKGNKTERK